MNRNTNVLMFFMLFLFCTPFRTNAFVVDVKPAFDKTETSKSSATVHSKKLTKKQLRKIKRQERKMKRLEKRLNKFQKKWEMRSHKKTIKKGKKQRRFFGGVTDEPRFQLGLILIVAALLIGVLSGISIIGALFGLISGIVGLVGLILIFLAVIEYY